MSALRRLVHEPVLQFLLVGLLLFVGYRAFGGTAESRARPVRIELTADDVRQLGIAWVAQGRPVPSPEEMQRLVDGRVREEILYREALVLGLDRDDTIVRRRMAQKMEFLFEDVAALRQPGAGELRAWFEGHAERFTRPARITFRHLWFSPDRRGPRACDDAARALEQIVGETGGSAATALADRFMFQDYYADRAPDDVAKTFGPGFARAVFQLAPGAWAGPIESGYGWHLVWVDAMTPPRVPPFEEVEAEVRTAWLEDERAEIRERAFAALRARYEVVLPKEVSVADLATLPAAELARVVPR